MLIGRLRALTGLALSIAVITATATPARAAFEEPTWLEGLSSEQRQALINSYVMIRGTQDLPFTKAAGTADSYYAERVAQAVWDNEGLSTELDPIVRLHQSEQTRARVDAYIQPVPKMPGTSPSTIARRVCRPGPVAVVCAFTVGYTIGTGLRKVWTRLDADVVGPTGVWDVQLRQAPQDGPLYGVAGDYSTAFSPTEPEQPVIPAGMWAVKINGASINLQTGNACQDIRPNPTNVHVSHGLSYGRCDPTVPADSYWWRPADIAVIGRASGTMPSDWPPYCILVYGCFEQDWTALPSWPVIEQALEEYLEGPQGLLQRQIWEHIFNLIPPGTAPEFTDPQAPPPSLPDPMTPDGIYGAVKVPQGIGMPRDEYAAALRSLGFAVHVEVRFGFNRDHDAGDVLYVNPSPGTRAAAGSTVSVVVNPSTITVPTVRTDERGEDYANRAFELGWNPVVTLQETPVSEEDEIVEPETSPAQGAVGQPRQELVVWTGKRKKTREHRPGCESPRGLFSLPDPVEALADDLAELEILDRFPSTVEPGGKVLLRRGRTFPQPATDPGTGTNFMNYAGYGRRHIQAKHGWGPAEAAQTAATVAAPTRVDGPLTDRHVYELDFSRFGRNCTWKVVVGVDQMSTSVPDEFGPRGIITAYGSER